MRTFTFFLFLGNFLSAQNLVVNPGFEQNGRRPQDGAWAEPIRTGKVTGWSTPLKIYSSTMVYYFPNGNRVPMNNLGAMIPDPIEGDNCLELYVNRGNHLYLQGTLNDTLQKNELYIVKLSVAALLGWPYHENRLGIHFPETGTMEADSVQWIHLQHSPEIRFDSAVSRDSSGVWTTYTFLYRARGGEQSFVLGEFIYPGSPEPIFKVREAVVFYFDNITISPENSAIAPGKTLVTNSVYFETGKSDVLPESDSTLNEILTQLKIQPDLKAEIVGHTDAHGDKTANQKLSEERAKAVADFFISKGIDVSRITTRGCGSSQPVGDDDQKNRRVEFIFSE